MIPDHSKTIYLKLLTSKGTQIVNVISNATSSARISNVIIINDGSKINHAVQFDYQALDASYQPSGDPKSITRKFNFQIFTLEDIIYGQLRIWSIVNLPKEELRAVNLIGNVTSPAKIDYLKIKGNQELEYMYYDLKADACRQITKKFPFKILGLKEMYINSTRLPPATYNKALAKSLSNLINLANTNNLNFWATGRTMLGSIRCHGLIPTDDQVGMFAIDMTDVPKLYKILSETYRYFLHDVHGLFTNARQPFGTISVMDFTLSEGPRSVAEIFYYKKSSSVPEYWKNAESNDGFYWCNAGDKSSIWPKENQGILNFPSSMVLPLKEEWFYDQRVKIPNQAEEICQLVYGKNSLTHRNTEGVFAWDKDFKEEPIEDFSPL